VQTWSADLPSNQGERTARQSQPLARPTVPMFDFDFNFSSNADALVAILLVAVIVAVTLV
jgi:hypothetical protein